MSSTSILRIGGVNPIQVEHLQSTLLSYFNAKNEIITENRYFIANIGLVALEEDISPNSIEDGAVLVFDCTSSSSFRSLHSINANHPNCGDLLRLCIGIVPSQYTQHENEYSERVLWCLDHGYEYIEVDLSEEGIKSGFDQREKEGFARVIEAIQGTVWTSARMHKDKKSIVKELASSPPEKKMNENAHESNNGSERNISESDNLSQNAVESDDQKQNMEKESEEEKVEQCTNNEHHNDKKEEAEEAIFDDLEHVLNEAARIRNEAKQGNLSDDERRKMAADTAMKLMGMLDLMNGDSEEEDDSTEE